MSYLGWPRLHFSGRFQADVSTVNNDVRHYKSDAFLPQFQQPMVGYAGGLNERANGYWNPDGSGAWRLIGCQITGSKSGSGELALQDPAELGLRLAGSNDRVAGKMVDLDPQQQMVSEIWGLKVALDDAKGNRLLDSDYLVSTFTDLWKRQQVSDNFDQTLAAAFQSQLRIDSWGDLSAYPFLQALRDAAQDGLLSIRMNCFGYDRTPGAADYSTGRVVGSIGPSSNKEPRHFVVGRQLVPELVPKAPPFFPKLGVYAFTAKLHEQAKTVSADLGHCLPIQTAEGDFQDIGSLQLAVLKDPNQGQGPCVAPEQIALLGPVGYQAPNWYSETAGVVDFDYSGDAWLTEHIADHPLALVKDNGYGGYDVLIRETQDGLYVRADHHVYRLNPGESAQVRFYASRYGKPTAMKLKLARNNGLMGGAGTGATLNADTWPVPAIATPVEAFCFPSDLSIDDSGRASLTISANSAGPGNPRGYIDGQVYGLGYQIDQAPAGTLYDFWNFVSVLIWDAWPVPEHPTWYRDIQPILRQYGNLYPIMSRHLVDLGDYDSVVKWIEPLTLSFSLPLENPNHMPVTRDLSANKRTALLKWLTDLCPNGKPLLGDPADAPAPALPAQPVRVSEGQAGEIAPRDGGGKFDAALQAMALRATESADQTGGDA